LALGGEEGVGNGIIALQVSMLKSPDFKTSIGELHHSEFYFEQTFYQFAHSAATFLSFSC